jgi:Lysine methyltransferase
VACLRALEREPHPRQHKIKNLHSSLHQSRFKIPFVQCLTHHYDSHKNPAAELFPYETLDPVLYLYIVPEVMVTRLPLRVASSRSDSPKAIRNHHHHHQQQQHRGMASTVQSSYWSSASPSSCSAWSSSANPIVTPSNTCTTSSQQARLCFPRPLPQAPLLLLRGDELHVSPQGVAKSCYHLADDNTGIASSMYETLASRWTIEERYCLTNSTKSFVLRGPLYPSLVQQQQQRQQQQYDNPTIIELQEVDTRLAGTGGTTWEASIAMALYFTRHPQQLQGDIVELGSGVGLGGMLLHHVAYHQHHHNHHDDQQQEAPSITLTDGNEHVLHQCQINVQRYLDATNKNGTTINKSAAAPIQVKHLDWGDVLKDKRQPDNARCHETYNTVIGCDCAYRTQGNFALKETLKSLLRREDHRNNLMESNRDKNSCIHLFGPYNRAAYHELIDIMERDEQDLQVHVEWMELTRYRLAAGKPDSMPTTKQDAPSGIHFPFTSQSHQCRPRGYDLLQREDELKHASKSATKFLHVVATHKRYDDGIHNCNQRRNFSLSEID